MPCVMSMMTTAHWKEIDLVNGRIDKDQYDMTGRLVQSTTLEKRNTGASGEPTAANTHTVQSLEIGYDSYNRVNRLVQSLEDQKTKTDWCTEMHQDAATGTFLWT